MPLVHHWYHPHQTLSFHIFHDPPADAAHNHDLNLEQLFDSHAIAIALPCHETQTSSLRGVVVVTDINFFCLITSLSHLLAIETLISTTDGVGLIFLRSSHGAARPTSADVGVSIGLGIFAYGKGELLLLEPNCLFRISNSPSINLSLGGTGFE